MAFLTLLSMLDIFGEPVSLFYRKKTHFKTGLGGCFTLISFAVLLAYTWTIVESVRGKEYTVQTSIKYINSFDIDETF